MKTVLVALLALPALLALGMPADAAGGFFGSWLYNDGSQAFNGRAVAGAAPNVLANAAGVRCEYRYVVRNGQRIRYHFCE